MADEQTPDAPQDAPDDPADRSGADENLGDAGKRAIAAERNARRAAEKSTAELTERLKAFEDAGKTELEKLTGRVSSAEQERDGLKAELLRFTVADELGIQPAHRKYLTGATDRQIRQSAEGILADFAGSYTPQARVGPRTPVEALTASPGSASTGDADPNAWLRQMAGRPRNP